MATRTLTSRPLAVDPGLEGLTLASPSRRFAAFAVDVAVLAVPSLVVSLVVAVIALAVADPVGFDAVLAAVRGLTGGGWEMEAAAAEGAPDWYHELVRLAIERDMPGVSPELQAAWYAGDRARVREILAGTTIVITWGSSGAESPGAGVLQLRLDRFVPASIRAVSTYGVAALYFVLLTRGRRGCTLGKRLLRIEVMSLDGRRLGWLASLDRFLGYWQIPASLGWALADLWRDPNRRMPHDRLVNSVVIRHVRRAEPDPATVADPDSGNDTEEVG